MCTLDGQLSVFDVNADGHERMPYEYSFARAIGQKVRARNCDKVLKITGIFPYYTYLEDDAGNEFVGTPTTICPVEKYREGYWP